jgi:hypothetical protein
VDWVNLSTKSLNILTPHNKVWIVSSYSQTGGFIRR